jgi:hypothetical protein
VVTIEAVGGNSIEVCQWLNNKLLPAAGGTYFKPAFSYVRRQASQPEPERFVESDVSYIMRLKRKAQQNMAIVESGWMASMPCLAQMHGLQCQLPVGHVTPHQYRSSELNAVMLWVFADDGTTSRVLKRGEIRCYGREATVLCRGLIYSRRQNSGYEDDVSNFTSHMCDACFEILQGEWAAEWADYYSNVL